MKFFILASTVHCLHVKTSCCRSTSTFSPNSEEFSTQILFYWVLNSCLWELRQWSLLGFWESSENYFVYVCVSCWCSLALTCGDFISLCVCVLRLCVCVANAVVRSGILTSWWGVDVDLHEIEPPKKSRLVVWYMVWFHFFYLHSQGEIAFEFELAAFFKLILTF